MFSVSCFGFVFGFCQILIETTSSLFIINIIDRWEHTFTRTIRFIETTYGFSLPPGLRLVDILTDSTWDLIDIKVPCSKRSGR